MQRARTFVKGVNATQANSVRHCVQGAMVHESAPAQISRFIWAVLHDCDSAQRGRARAGRVCQSRHSTQRCLPAVRLRWSPRFGSHLATMKKPRQRSSSPIPRNARMASESRAAACHELQ